MHVLVIEDDEAFRHTLARVMRYCGFDAITLATNGAEALAVLVGAAERAPSTKTMSKITSSSSSSSSASQGASRRPDVIVTDLQMPEMDGLTFAQRLRGRGDRTPLIMLSGRDDEDAVAAAIEAGVNCFLPKPVTIPDLLSALRLVLPTFASAA